MKQLLKAVAGGALQAERAQLLQNYSLFGCKWRRKGPCRLSGTLAWCCTAHLGQVPYPRYNSWVLAFADLKGSKRGEMQTAASQIALDVLLSICAWNCFLDESTDCSQIEQCEGEYCVKVSSLGMYVVQFLVTHRAISRTWSLKLAGQPVLCSDSGVSCP